MAEIEKKTVIVSSVFENDVIEVFQYGEDTFGQSVAQSFVADMYAQINGLAIRYLYYPECRHLQTKGEIYRNIILGSYLIIYRITSDKVEVLRILSSFRSISHFRSARKITI